MLSLLTLLACGPGEAPSLTPELVLRTEPTLRVEGEATLTNRWTRQELIVEAITLDPEGGPGKLLLPDAEWTLLPGESRTVTIRFEPDEEGSWSQALRFDLWPEEERSTAVHYLSAVGEDADGDGWSPSMGDCDDEDATTWPGAPERCDAADNDCDGDVDEDFDADHDGHLSMALCPSLGDDCDDADRTAYTGHEEECDGTDSDCNGAIDDVHLLADRQGGLCAGMEKVCTPSGPREPDYRVLPGFQEYELACDGVDNDCDGGVDDFDWSGDGTSDCTDDDGDGVDEAHGDCHDDDPSLGRSDCTTRLAVTSMDDPWGLRIHHLELDWEEAVEVWVDGALSPLYAAYQVEDLGQDRVLYTDQRGTDVLLVDLWERTVADAVSLDPDSWVYDVEEVDGAVWVGLGDRGLLSLDAADLSDETSLEQVALGDANLFTRRGDSLWGCGNPDGRIWRYSLLDGGLDVLDPGFQCTSAPVFDEDGGQALFSNLMAEDDTGAWVGQIARVDLDDFSLLGIEVLPLYAYRMHLDGGGVWVATNQDNRLVYYDLDTWEALVDLDFGASVHDVWVDSERGRLWVAVYGADQVVVIDPSDWSEVARYPVIAPDFLESLP